MEIMFADKKLEKLLQDDRKLFMEHGKVRAMKLKSRLDQLRYAATLEDVRYIPGNYHELTGDRKGQWACDLDQPYRLVFTPVECPIPSNEHGQFIWVEIKEIEILGIVNYHKDK